MPGMAHRPTGDMRADSRAGRTVLRPPITVLQQPIMVPLRRTAPLHRMVADRLRRMAVLRRTTRLRVARRADRRRMPRLRVAQRAGLHRTAHRRAVPRAERELHRTPRLRVEQRARLRPIPRRQVARGADRLPLAERVPAARVPPSLHRRVEERGLDRRRVEEPGPDRRLVAVEGPQPKRAEPEPVPLLPAAVVERRDRLRRRLDRQHLPPDPRHPQRLTRSSHSFDINRESASALSLFCFAAADWRGSERTVPRPGGVYTNVHRG